MKPDFVKLYSDYSDICSEHTYMLEHINGWYDDIKSVLEYCQMFSIPVKFVQIKEKFGDLRMYYDVTDNRDPELSEKLHALDVLISKCGNRCIDCGDPNYTMRKDGWVRKTCDSCEDARKASRNY